MAGKNKNIKAFLKVLFTSREISINELIKYVSG